MANIIIIAAVLIDLEHNMEMKGLLITIFSFLGLILALISNLSVAPWRQVLKLYLMMDSIVPVLIVSVIGCYEMLNFFKFDTWYKISYAITYPIWSIYYVGSLRVMIIYA